MVAKNFFIASGVIIFARKAHSTLGGKLCGNGNGVGRVMLCLSFVSLNCRGMPGLTFCRFDGFAVDTSELTSQLSL